MRDTLLRLKSKKDWKRKRQGGERRTWTWSASLHANGHGRQNRQPARPGEIPFRNFLPKPPPRKHKSSDSQINTPTYADTYADTPHTLIRYVVKPHTLIRYVVTPHTLIRFTYADTPNTLIHAVRHTLIRTYYIQTCKHMHVHLLRAFALPDHDFAGRIAREVPDQPAARIPGGVIRPASASIIRQQQQQVENRFTSGMAGANSSNSKDNGGHAEMGHASGVIGTRPVRQRPPIEGDDAFYPELWAGSRQQQPTHDEQRRREKVGGGARPTSAPLFKDEDEAGPRSRRPASALGGGQIAHQGHGYGGNEQYEGGGGRWSEAGRGGGGEIGRAHV